MPIHLSQRRPLLLILKTPQISQHKFRVEVIRAICGWLLDL
jgi:hypothetical protein